MNDHSSRTGRSRRNQFMCSAILSLALHVGCASPTSKLASDEPGALITAIETGRLNDVRDLLNRGVNPNGVAQTPSPLYVAAAKGNQEAVSLLLAGGADPNQRELHDEWGTTPLMIASNLGRADIVSALLASGAIVDLQSGPFQVRERIGTGGDALFQAVSHGHLDVARLLLLAGAETTRRHLHSAISQGNVDMAWLMLAAGSDPRWVFLSGRSALEEAERLPSETRQAMKGTLESFFVHDPPVGEVDEQTKKGPEQRAKQ